MNKKIRDFRKDKEDFLNTHKGREEYDAEIERLTENRRRWNAYYKVRSIKGAEKAREDAE